MKFLRKSGYQIKAKPQVVGEVCWELEKKGQLTPQNLVEVSKPKNAPLHNEFQWNDKVAAKMYRETRAMYLIRSVAVEVKELPKTITQIDLELTVKEPTVRFFHAVVRDGNFDSIETVAADEEKRNVLLNQCLKDMEAFKEKYYILRSVLPELFDVIERITNK
jgi:hypothetical protein